VADVVVESDENLAGLVGHDGGLVVPLVLLGAIGRRPASPHACDHGASLPHRTDSQPDPVTLTV
jgi:hypothetical protein